MGCNNWEKLITHWGFYNPFIIPTMNGYEVGKNGCNKFPGYSEVYGTG